MSGTLKKDKDMAKRNKLSAPDEIVFCDVTRAELDQLIYGMLSVRMHNNMAIPECYRNGNEGGVYSDGFAEYERRKFGIVNDTDLDGYNLDI